MSDAHHNPDLDMMNPLQVLNNAYIEGDYDAIVHCRRVLGIGPFKPSKGFPIQNLSICRPPVTKKEQP